MKIFLIYPPSLSSYAYGQPRTVPLGICYLASALIEKGHQVKLIDMRLKGYDYSYLKNLLKKIKPPLVGISATSFDYPGAKEVLRLIKEISPKIITIVGGTHISLAGEDVIKSSKVDIVLKGEGEKVLPKIVNCLEKNKSLSTCEGIMYKTKNGRIIDKRDKKKFIFDLDSLSFPRLDLLPLDKYRVAGKLLIPIMTSRGCPYNCIFCTNWQTHGKAFRKRSPTNVVDEIEYAIKKYETKNFNVMDDNFAFEKKRAIDICQEIIKRKLNITWQCDQGIRADMADEELFFIMKESGCKLVAIGIESADPKVLKAIRKGETITTMKKAIRLAKKVGLVVKGFFIVGAPGDSEESVKKSVHFFKTSGIDIPRFSNMTAFPSTDLWKWVEKNGRFIDSPLDYIAKHADSSTGAQFETEKFPRDKRIKMFNWVNAEAEKWTIKYKLNSMYGKKIGGLLFNILKLNIFRALIKKMFQLRLIKPVN